VDRSGVTSLTGALGLRKALVANPPPAIRRADSRARVRRSAPRPAIKALAAPVARQTGRAAQCPVTDTDSGLWGAGQVRPAQCQERTPARFTGGLPRRLWRTVPVRTIRQRNAVLKGLFGANNALGPPYRHGRNPRLVEVFATWVRIFRGDGCRPSTAKSAEFQNSQNSTFPLDNCRQSDLWLTLAAQGTALESEAGVLYYQHSPRANTITRCCGYARGDLFVKCERTGFHGTLLQKCRSGARAP